MKGSFIPTSLFVIVVVASGIGGQQHTALALPSCNSDRPNSWATHRTLSIPNSPEFFNKNSDDDDDATVGEGEHKGTEGGADQEDSERAAAFRRFQEQRAAAAARQQEDRACDAHRT